MPVRSAHVRSARQLAAFTRLASVICVAAGAACASGGGTSAGAGTSGPLAAPRASVASAPKSDWIQLFNGRDLSGWDVKFAKHPLGDNYNDTFRVEDGMLRVRYDKYTGWNGEWGHIFYRRPFRYYLVAAEYRFIDNQVVGATKAISWAIRNNGIMMGQSAASMGLNQDYPISLEVQLLGGLSDGKPRSTANLCTPGTNVHFGDSLVTTHCINSKSKTYDGDQWVRVEALVLSDSVIKHIAGGDTVLVYRKPEMGGGAANNTAPGVFVPGKPMTEFYISLQAETAPTDFRKVEVLNLEGCMDPTFKSYRAYFIKSDPAACR